MVRLRVGTPCRFDQFYLAADPQKENLCLYGHPNSTWSVELPAEEVPPETPEPSLGINFARDGMSVRPGLCQAFRCQAGSAGTDIRLPHRKRTGLRWWQCTQIPGSWRWPFITGLV